MTFRPYPKSESVGAIKPPKKSTKSYTPTGEGDMVDAMIEEMKIAGKKCICTGCGVVIPNPNHVNWSHIIQKSLRPDLRLKEENGSWQCQSCHSLWDASPLNVQYARLKDFASRMKFIYLHDKRVFWQKINKLKDQYGIDFMKEFEV